MEINIGGYDFIIKEIGEFSTKFYCEKLDLAFGFNQYKNFRNLQVISTKRVLSDKKFFKKYSSLIAKLEEYLKLNN